MLHLTYDEADEFFMHTTMSKLGAINRLRRLAGDHTLGHTRRAAIDKHKAERACLNQ